MHPNSRALQHYDDIKNRLYLLKDNLDAAKVESRRLAQEFAEVKATRYNTFMAMFRRVKDEVGPVYNELTRIGNHNRGGQASLLLEDDSDEPYLSGIKYHTIVPG